MILANFITVTSGVMECGEGMNISATCRNPLYVSKLYTSWLKDATGIWHLDHAGTQRKLDLLSISNSKNIGLHATVHIYCVYSCIDI